MRPLDGPDLFPLAQERPGHPMHTLKVAVLQRAVTCEDVDRWAADTLTAVEPLRRRLVRLYGARPVWVDGGTFDVYEHVHHEALPEPGGEQQLVEFLSMLCAGEMERSRPLWRLWHLEGLSGDRDALVLQVHHAIADGRGSVSLWEAMADPSARGPRAPSAWSRRDLVRTTLSQATRDLARLPGRLARMGRHGRASKDAGVVASFAGDSTRFNGDPEAERRCAFVSLPLSRLRVVASAAGATLNDVYLTLVGGALRHHLDGLGEPLGGTLSATVPAALPERLEVYGNSVTTLYVDLHADVADPQARLDAVRRSVASTRQVSDRDPRVLADLQRHPRVYRTLVKGMALAERRRGAPAYHLTVSNVRGPAPLRIMDVPVVELRSVGPLFGRLGLNLTGWSYGDDFVVGIHAYASAADGLDDLADLLVEELDALEAAVQT